MATNKLTVKDRALYAGENIVLVVYPAGDCDRINWPLKKGWRPLLAAALFSMYETGQINDRIVMLPDGKPFDIDVELRDLPALDCFQER